MTIASPGSVSTARVLPDCTVESGLAGPFLAGLEGFGGPSAASPLAADGPSTPSTATGGVQPDAPAAGGVRGEESPPLLTFPPPHVFGDSERLPALLGLAVLALLAVSLLGVGVEVIRHLRSPGV